MPTLAQFAGDADPTLIQFVDNIPLVEPLDGPTSVDDVMDRFPEEVYQQGRDTHLYRFLLALAGDSGAGLVKAQTFAARLKFEAEFLNFQVLDDFYAAQFTVKRLRSETYPSYNPETDALTPTIWDAILLADQSYKQRIAEFFTATRYGTPPTGMAIVAQAGCGVECEVVENYKWVFDQFSDDPLGLPFVGTTAATGEFIVVPRFTGEDALAYEQQYGRMYTGDPASLDDSIRPSLGGVAPAVDIDFNPDPQTRMDPAVERNLIDLIDRLRPVGSIASVIPEDVRYLAVLTNGDAFASSERVQVNRLVTGAADVPWPPLDPSHNYFIESGVEHETGHYYGSAHELPIVFQTIEGVHAYTDLALSDPLYGTNEFFDASSGISEFDHFRSEQYGSYPLLLMALYPFLSNVAPDTAFVALNAIAINDTPLKLEGSSL